MYGLAYWFSDLLYECNLFFRRCLKLELNTSAVIHPICGSEKLEILTHIYSMRNVEKTVRLPVVKTKWVGNFRKRSKPSGIKERLFQLLWHLFTRTPRSNVFWFRTENIRQQKSLKPGIQIQVLSWYITFNR